jgi:hypothetical protein
MSRHSILLLKALFVCWVAAWQSGLLCWSGNQAVRGLNLGIDNFFKLRRIVNEWWKIINGTFFHSDSICDSADC